MDKFQTVADNCYTLELVEVVNGVLLSEKFIADLNGKSSIEIENIKSCGTSIAYQRLGLRMKHLKQANEKENS